MHAIDGRVMFRRLLLFTPDSRKARSTAQVVGLCAQLLAVEDQNVNSEVTDLIKNIVGNQNADLEFHNANSSKNPDKRCADDDDLLISFIPGQEEQKRKKRSANEVLFQSQSLKKQKTKKSLALPAHEEESRKKKSAKDVPSKSMVVKKQKTQKSLALIPAQEKDNQTERPSKGDSCQSIVVRNEKTQQPLAIIPAQEEENRKVKRAKDNSSKSIVVKKQEIQKSPVKEKVYLGLETRTSPFKFQQLIEALSVAQKSAFRKTALGHLLDIKIGRLPKYYAHHIVDKYNHRTQEIKLKGGKALPVRVQDVRTALGLPMGSISMSTGISADECKTRIARWKSQFSGKNKKSSKPEIKMAELKSLILSNLNDVGANFIRNMLVYIITALIYCTGSESVYLDPIPYLEDVDSIHELNWCQFVYEKLSIARDKWSPTKPFYGPILFLIVHYSDMVIDSLRIVERKYPKVLNYTTKLLNDRQNKEKNHKDGFGMGFIAEEMIISEAGKGSSSHQQTVNDDDQQSKLPPKEKSPQDVGEKCQAKNQSNNEPQDVIDPQVYFQDYMELLGKAASIFKDVDVMSKKIIGLFPEHDVLCNLAIKSREAFNMASIVKAASKDIAPDEENEGTHTRPKLSQDSFWERPEILKQIDEICEQIQAAKQCFHPHQVDLTPPSFSLGVSQDFEEFDALRLNKEQPIPDTELQTDEQNEQQQDAIPVDVIDLQTDDQIVLQTDVHLPPVQTEFAQIMTKDTAATPVLAVDQGVTSSTVIDKARGVGTLDVQRVTRTEKEIDAPKKLFIKIKNPSVYDKSPYMIRCMDPRSQPSAKETKLANFIIEMKDIETDSYFFYEDNKFSLYLQSEDMYSLVKAGHHIESNILTIYTFVLNHMEKYKSPESPTRLHLPIQLALIIQSDNSAHLPNWKTTFNSEMTSYIERLGTIKNARDIDMFLFPVIRSGHFYIVCFNVKFKKIEILDNSSAEFTDEDPLLKYDGIPQILKQLFVAWLETICPANARCLDLVEVTRLRLKWANDTNKVDCGVYAMRHMETYFGEGESYDCGLTTKAFSLLKNLRIKYAYQFINFEGNQCRLEVLDKVSKYKGKGKK